MTRISIIREGSRASSCVLFQCVSRMQIVIVVTLLMILIGCSNAFFENGTKITINDNAVPPSFSFSGSGMIQRIFVYGPYKNISVEEIKVNLDRPAIWEIDPPPNTDIVNIPVVKYGVLPQGFTQVKPSSDPPPKLLDEQCYRIIAPTLGANEGSIHFCIRNGKAVKVANP